MAVQEIVTFRQKYPQYSDMDDAALADRLAAKYPAYADLPDKVRQSAVPFDPALPNRAEVMKQIAQREDPASGAELPGGMAGNIAKRFVPGANLIDLAMQSAVPFQRTEAAVAAPALEAQAGNFSPSTLIRSAAQGLKGENKAQMGDLIRTTGVGGENNEKLAAGFGLLTSAPIFGGVSKVGPKAGRVAEKAITLAEKGTGTALQKAGAVARTFLEPTDKVIDRAIAKAVRPPVSGKQTAGHIQKYHERAREAVKSIVENKASLDLVDDAGRQKLPENLNEFSQAIEQTKAQVFSKYDALTKQSGQQGAVVDLMPAAREVVKGGSAKPVKTLYPEVEAYALKQAEALQNAKTFTPEEAQQTIKLLNKSLEAYYKNPSPETASRAVIDASIANNLRNALDDVVMKATGEAYKPLKQQYAALKAIEKDVAHRAVVAGRQNPKGLIDFTDIISGGNIIRGMLKLNPADFATGVAQKGIANYIKKVNSPDRIVRDMFRTVSKRMDFIK